MKNSTPTDNPEQPTYRDTALRRSFAAFLAMREFLANLR